MKILRQASEDRITEEMNSGTGDDCDQKESYRLIPGIRPQVDMRSEPARRRLIKT